VSKAIALTIGGSDSGGGAGIQADIKTFMALEVHGCSAITCITAQNSHTVNRVDPVSPISVKSQITSIVNDFKISAVKTGMLLNKKIIETTAESLSVIKVPKFIDPVMVSRTGSVLIEPDAIEAYKKLIIKEGELITPNIYEASIISGVEIKDSNDVKKAAINILSKGVNGLLIKGGGIKELKGKDYFLDTSNNGVWLNHNPIETQNTHGSGCTLIAAITAYRAKKFTLKESILKAKLFIESAIKNSYKIGSGPGTLCHWNSN
tara:strand:- start:475 stop:1263 length:789 start_codon:yes stop_codon:yes gene_type:complete